VHLFADPRMRKNWLVKLLLVFDANHGSANDPYFTEILAHIVKNRWKSNLPAPSYSSPRFLVRYHFNSALRPPILAKKKDADAAKRYERGYGT
jgi:hypothetical protein